MAKKTIPQRKTEAPIPEGEIRRAAERAGYVPPNRDMRAIAVAALATNSDPEKAEEVLYRALETVEAELWVAHLALEMYDHGGRQCFETTLHALSHRVGALKTFVDHELNVTYKPEGAP